MTPPRSWIFRTPCDTTIMTWFLSIILNKHFFSARQGLNGYAAFRYNTVHNPLLYCSLRLGYIFKPLGLKICHYIPSYVLRNQDPRDNVMEALISIDRALLASLILILCKREKHDKLMTQAFPLHPSSFRFRFANFLLWTKGFRFQPLHQTGIDKQFKSWLFCWAKIFQTPFAPEPARAGGVILMLSPAPLNWVGLLSWQVATSWA